MTDNYIDLKKFLCGTANELLKMLFKFKVFNTILKSGILLKTIQTEFAFWKKLNLAMRKIIF